MSASFANESHDGLQTKTYLCQGSVIRPQFSQLRQHDLIVRVVRYQNLTGRPCGVHQGILHIQEVVHLEQHG